jgi:tripartite ATP-independent transporter DctP family solute receptor
MRVKYWLIILIVVLFLGLFCGGGTAAGTTNETETAAFPKMEIIIAHTDSSSPDSISSAYSNAFAEYVSEKTNNNVTFRIYGDGILGDDEPLLEGVRMGNETMVITSPFAIAKIEPCHDTISLPLLFKDIDDVHKFLDSDLAAEMNGELEKYGIKVLGVIDGGFRQMVSKNKPIIDMNSLKGLKWRVPNNPLYVKTFKLLGANPVPMGGLEVFTALQQGTIDGCEFPVSSIYDDQYYKVAKYLTITNHIYMGWYVLFNKNTWDSCSPELKQIFTDAAAKALQNSRNIFVQNYEKELAVISKSMEVKYEFDISAMQEAVKPLYEEYRTRIGETYFDRAMEQIGITL